MRFIAGKVMMEAWFLPIEPIHAALPTALIGLAVGFGVGGAILLARRRDT